MNNLPHGGKTWCPWPHDPPEGWPYEYVAKVDFDIESADAARYRWLVEECKYMPWGRVFPGINAGKGIDEAIDEQIAIQKAENNS